MVDRSARGDALRLDLRRGGRLLAGNVIHVMLTISERKVKRGNVRKKERERGRQDWVVKSFSL